MNFSESFIEVIKKIVNPDVIIEVPKDKEAKKFLLKRFELEHEEILSQFKIIFVASISAIYGIIIATATNQIVVENKIGFMFGTSYIGLLAIFFITLIYHLKLKDIRGQIDLLVI